MVSAPEERRTTARLPVVVWLLTLGTFLMGTSEYVVAGILPTMSADLGVGIAQGGLLITFFAAGLIVGPPLLSVATLRLPRRSTLVLALLVFALGHALAALSSSFVVVLTARAVTALATGTFWAVAGAVAIAAVGPGSRARASALIISGVGLATVLGVPLGALVGDQVGWRGTFWALAALAAATALVIGRYVPTRASTEAVPDVRSEITALRSGRLWLALAVSTLLFGGVLAAYSYVVPLLTDRAGVPAGAISLVLVGYGIGALGGTYIGGRLGDARPLTTQLGAVAVAGTALILLRTPLSTSAVVAVALLVVMGVAAQSVPPISTVLAVRFAPAAPTLAYALATSALNVGITAGSLVGGLALDASRSLTGPPLVGSVMVALSLVPLLALARATSPRSHLIQKS